jgi:hypothetical protein
MNLKFKTALIGNREHVILDNPNNLSDFRGQYGELKHLACQVANHLNKPVTIPAFLVVDDPAAIERIKRLLADKCINPVVINTQNAAVATRQQQLADSADENSYLSSRNRYNQQQHPHLIQTLNSNTRASMSAPNSANQSLNNGNETSHQVVTPKVEVKETQVPVKVEKPKKPRAPRTKKATALQNSACFTTNTSTSNNTIQTNGCINNQQMIGNGAQLVYSDCGGQFSLSTVKQPSQTCAELLSKTSSEISIASVTNSNSVHNTPGKSASQTSCLNTSNSTTPTANAKGEQKKPRIQKINEILMSNSNSNISPMNTPSRFNGNQGAVVMTALNSNDQMMNQHQQMFSQQSCGDTTTGITEQQQMMERQIQQAVETFNSMDHHSLEMHQFIDSQLNDDGSGSVHRHLGDESAQTKGSTMNNFINDGVSSDSFQGHMFVNSGDGAVVENGNCGSKLVSGGGGGGGCGNNSFTGNDYNFNFDPFDTNVLFGTNLNDLV